MRKHDKVEWIYKDLVSSPCCIGVCRSDVAFRRELKRLSVPPEQWPEKWLSADKDGCVWEFKKHDGTEHCIVVCIGSRRGVSLDSWVGIFVHEAVHVWQKVREFLGETNPSNEFEVYAIQNIAQRLLVAAGMK